MKLTLAQPEQSSRAMSIIDMAKAHLRSQGIDQWQTGYPDLACIENDLLCQKGYFLTDGPAILGYLCIDFDGEPAYACLNGTWLHEGSYAAVHRMAMDDACRGRGLAGTAFDLVRDFCVQQGVQSIRADTDHGNQKMRHILKKSGFSCCGTIWFDNSEKIAFEKLL